MLNKKLLTAFSFVAILLSSNAFAKTEGNYFGVEAVRSDVKFKSNGEYDYNGNLSGGSTINYQGTVLKDIATGWGLSYKHAFNFGNNAFIAPGIFFEENNIKYATGRNLQLKIRNRRGINVDFGYDITDNSALYLSAGWGQISYSSEINNNLVYGALESKLSKLSNGAFYGIGLAHNISKNLAANIEFNTQKAKIEAQYGNSFKTSVRTLKVGLAYRF